MASLPPAVQPRCATRTGRCACSRGPTRAEAERALANAAPGQLDVWRPVESLQRETAKLRPVVYGVSALLLRSRW
jgi:hypothetical protein